MSLDFPIVKIDRTTAQEMLPIFINKGIFSNYDTLRSKEDILEEKKKELGTESLTPEQMREVLSKEGRYKTKKNVIRDCGDYIIALSTDLHYGNDTNENIEDALKQVKLHKLGHKVATIILAEAFIQNKLDEVEIPKEKLLQYLGYTSEEKNIYQDIADVLFSLRSLNYQIYKFKNKTSGKIKSEATGNFIHYLENDGKNYKISISRNFIGCIKYWLINDDNRTEEERKKLFGRGYYDYPTSFLPVSKDYSTATYLLGNFLIMDSGNAKLKKPGHKVVAYETSKLIQECKIEHSRDSKKVKLFLDALREVQIIERINPSLETLLQMKPSKLLSTIIHITIKSTVKGIDDKIQSKNE